MMHVELSRLFELSHQRQALLRGDDHLKSAGTAVSESVLAGLVDVKGMVRMLNH